MRIFLDTADIEEIRRAARLGVVSGVTTNPSLFASASRKGGGDGGRAREGAAPDLEVYYQRYRERILEIASVIDGPISAECLSREVEGLLEEARRLASWHPNVVVKIPVDEAGLEATAHLAKEGVRINTTLVFSPNQALLAATAGAAYISPFVGRLDDIATNGMDLIREIVDIYGNYAFRTEVLVASCRHPIHVVEAARAGADVATCPPAVIDQMFNHPLTNIGLEKFLKDWEKAQAVKA